MLHFRNDYSAGAHPAVLEALCQTNLDLTSGYGTDPYCARAAEAVRQLCRIDEDMDVHFFVGGTQVNKTFIGALLRPWEAVIAAETGHICVHETGAVEQDGHKVLTCPAIDGKLTPELVRLVVESHAGEHMVVPRLVYISNPTELGTVYTLQELKDLFQYCVEHRLLIYCDGARLGCALDASDITFHDYAMYCDAFTIGGTKNGLLFGEALVIPEHCPVSCFRHCMKQQGAILAKGRLLGVQFEAVLKDGLYLDLARHSNRLGQRLTEGLRAKGIPLLVDSPTNQVFPIFPNETVRRLEQEVAFEIQEAIDEDHTCIRLVTAWNSTEEDVDAFLALL